MVMKCQKKVMRMADFAELVKSLRKCSYGDCIGCKNEQIQEGCRSKLEVEAADAIKELQKQCQEKIKVVYCKECFYGMPKPEWTPDCVVYLCSISDHIRSGNYYCASGRPK